VHARTAGLKACIAKCRFERRESSRREARPEIAVHRRLDEPGGSTRTTRSDNLRSRPGGLPGVPTLRSRRLGSVWSEHTLSTGSAPWPEPINAIGHLAGDRMGPRVDRIVLIGLRRSGKSTVGRLVSDAIGWTLIDTDELVHRMTGTSPADWIRERGLAAFRAAECGAVAALGGARDAVIATGGGVPLSQENREALRPGALIAYLRVDPWVLVGRTLSDPADALRPRLAAGSPSEENYVLFAERDALYRSYCDLIVDAARAPDEVAARVLDASRIEKKNLRS
jgi:shikimate kinase